MVEDLIIALIPLAIVILTIAGMWKTFAKADQPGWAAIIPIYNIWIIIKITQNEWWWLLLVLFVPIVNFFAYIKLSIDLAKSFGRGLGFGLGLVFLPFIFFPLLGFGEDRYQWGSGTGATGAGSNL